MCCLKLLKNTNKKPRVETIPHKRPAAFPQERSPKLGQGWLLMAALSFSPAMRRPLRNWPESLPEGMGALVLEGRRPGDVPFPGWPPWPLHRCLVQSVSPNTKETCPLSELCPGLLGAASWASGHCSQGAMVGAGAERGPGARLKERGSGDPRSCFLFILPTHFVSPVLATGPTLCDYV